MGEEDRDRVRATDIQIQIQKGCVTLGAEGLGGCDQ